MRCWPFALNSRIVHNLPAATRCPTTRGPVTLPLDVAQWATKGLPQDSSHLPEWDDYITGVKANTIFLSVYILSLIHISEPTRLGMISYAVFCLKKKKK